MTNPIEAMHRRQQRCWRLFLIAYFLLVGALILRHVFGTALREYDLNAQPIGIALLVGSVCLLLALFIIVSRLAGLFPALKYCSLAMLSASWLPQRLRSRPSSRIL